MTPVHPASPEEQAAEKPILRFLTCGSVDDGKSTLIGRLLYESNQIFDDTLQSLESESKVHGTTGDNVDFALLVDGLQAEREQGITIDVAYRYFATAKRKFIVADTPGHVQYTRNMVTGASTANLAIILVDARQGVIQQTRRHAYIASLLRIPHLVLCVNKMDLIGYDENIFNHIKQEFSAFAAGLGIQDVTFIPISALKGDNIVEKSDTMAWYFGPPLLRHLEDVYIDNDRNLSDPRFPVQYVIRPHRDEYHDFRGFAGQVVGGIFHKGDPVMVLPSGKTSRIADIHTYEGSIDQAFTPMSATLLLEDDIDISRGDMLVKPGNVPHLTQDFEAMVCWMSEQPLRKGIKYGLKHTTRSARCMIKDIQHRINIDTLEPEAGIEQLGLNDIARLSIKTNVPLAFDAYARNRYTGGFILIDEATNTTLAAGMICEPV
ncbi:MAG: sulfate adenylyltransferase subunit CysN, partial [Verrucomicrobiae bacterium]|nr:sulfate adenylyltransferase subunit CysN [Verrucomicrobiae bacterium]